MSKFIAKNLYLFFAILLSFCVCNILHANTEQNNITTQKNWYDNFIFKDPSFSFELIRTLGAAYTQGADLGESISTALHIKQNDIQSWYNEWFKTANRILDMAKKMQANGHGISAMEAFFRASNYYRTAGFYAVSPNVRQEAVTAWEKSRAAFQNAIAYIPNSAFLRIPYEDTTLPAYYFKAEDFIAKDLYKKPSKSMPLLILMTGFDGTAEELFFEMGLMALKRGYNVLMFEGPGQGEMIIKQNIPFRHDWEVVMKSVLDFAHGLPNINKNQIALVGFSMGGYFAPRACAFENRIKACVANGGIWDLREALFSNFPKELQFLVDTDPSQFNNIVKKMMPYSIVASWFFNNGFWRFNVNTPADLFEKLKQYNLNGVAHQIKMPILVIESESDNLLTPNQGKLLYDTVSGPKTFKLFTKEEAAEAHCQEGALAISNEFTLNWLDETLEIHALHPKPSN